MGIIATRSIDTPVLGLKDLMKQHEVRIRNGMVSYGQLQQLLAGDKSPELRAAFEASKRPRLWSSVKTICSKCC
ncbi:hypothetical protein [Providencia rustigianii]|uniref:hypothetical protein n=1 Tax=Providencia rustigianii TaxID=158850 RepID=UPI0035E549C7